MKKLNNKGLIDSDTMEIIVYIVGSIVLVASFIFYLHCVSLDKKNTQEEEAKVEALMKNDDYVYLYNGIEIDAEAAKDLLINGKYSFYKEEGTMNIYIKKDE